MGIAGCFASKKNGASETCSEMAFGYIIIELHLMHRKVQFID